MIELHKVNFQVVVVIKNEDGDTVEERTAAEGSVFPVGLDDFPDEVRKIVGTLTDAVRDRT